MSNDNRKEQNTKKNTELKNKFLPPAKPTRGFYVSVVNNWDLKRT